MAMKSLKPWCFFVAECDQIAGVYVVNVFMVHLGEDYQQSVFFLFANVNISLRIMLANFCSFFLKSCSLFLSIIVQFFFLQVPSFLRYFAQHSIVKVVWQIRDKYPLGYFLFNCGFQSIIAFDSFIKMWIMEFLVVSIIKESIIRRCEVVFVFFRYVSFVQ